MLSSVSAASPDSPLVLVLDIGTTGLKGMLFTPEGAPLGRAYAPLRKSHPRRGWVEQDPAEIAGASERVLGQVVRETGTDPARIVACGIANQRETIIAWDAETGQALYPAIVWEDARTRRYCAGFDEATRATVRNKTGLTIDSYFTASKLRWLLCNVPEVRSHAKQGRLRVGTVDTWALWNLVEGRPHVTDYTNASRTLLYDIHRLQWDDELLNLFEVPRSPLPSALPSRSRFGNLRPEIVGAPVPVRAVLGDQQSSTYASGTATGTTKVTYGTGIFMVQVIGPEFALHDPFFTTLVAGPRAPWYGIEAKVGVGGARITPILDNDAALRRMLTTMAKEVALQVTLLPQRPEKLVLDGGIAQAEYLVEIQQEATGIPCVAQKVHDGTALGVGLLAAEAWQAGAK